MRVALASGCPPASWPATRAPTLAVLAVDRDLPVARLAVSMGNPLGFENSATAGGVSGLTRSVPSDGQTPRAGQPRRCGR